MEFIHLADLHLGKQFNGVSLLEDQKAVLFEQIVPMIEKENVDAVLIAGDVYQSSAPQAEAMEVFSKFLSEVVSLGKKVFIISGNHDSSQRISYFSSLIKQAGVYVSETFDGTLQSIDLSDEYGPLTIYMLPFVRTALVKKLLPDESISTCQDAVEAVLRQTEIDRSKRNILICHQFITGSETSDSEEFSVGGLDNIEASIFDDFDYVALGHIHKPQKVKRETLRYAGSPIKYSFSEANQNKCVTIVDVKEKGNIEISTLPIYQVHDVRKVEGYLDELLEGKYTEDYVWVTIHDENVPPDATITLRSVFPNMMNFSVVNSKTKTDFNISGGEDIEDKTILELFEDFYRMQNNDQEMSEKHKIEFKKVLEELEEER